MPPRAAEGELPRPPNAGRVIELRNAQDEVGSLECRDGEPPVWSVGRGVQLADLALQGLRTTAEGESVAEAKFKGRALACPNCGAALEPKLAESRSMTCGQCQAVVELPEGDAQAVAFAGEDEQRAGHAQDVQGALQIKKKFEDAVFIFILPPSLETLRDRLLSRNADSQEVIQRRLQKVKEEVWSFREYYYIVRNDDLGQSLRERQSIFLAEQLKTKRLDMNWFEQNFILDRDPKYNQRDPSTTT